MQVFALTQNPCPGVCGLRIDQDIEVRRSAFFPEPWREVQNGLARVLATRAVGDSREIGPRSEDGESLNLARLRKCEKGKCR